MLLANRKNDILSLASRLFALHVSSNLMFYVAVYIP